MAGVELKYGVKVTTPGGPGVIRVVKRGVASVQLANGVIKSYNEADIRVPLTHGVFHDTEEQTGAVAYQEWTDAFKTANQPLFDLIIQTENFIDDSDIGAEAKATNLLTNANRLVKLAGEKTELILLVFPTVLKAITELARILGLSN